MSEKTPLAERLYAKAEIEPDNAYDLMAKADEFESAHAAYYGAPEDTPKEETDKLCKKFLGAWARAKRAAGEAP